MKTSKKLFWYVLVLTVLVCLAACSRKEDTETQKHTKASGKDSVQDPVAEYNNFLSAIDGSVISMLPARTYGFLLFLNTDDVARKQKEYWEKDLSPEIKELINSSLSGFESILEDSGLLGDKKVEEIYTMESAQFISAGAPTGTDEEKAAQADKPEEAGHAGFITRLKLENLQDKGKEVAEAVSAKGTPAKVVQEGPVCILEFEDQGVIVPAFRYLGLKDSYIVSASSKEVIEEVFSADTDSWAAIFTDPEFIEIASKLSSLDKSVIFGGLKGQPSTALPFAFGMYQDGFDPGASLKNGNDSSEEMLVAFNQSFDDSYAAELRVKTSDAIKQLLGTGDSEHEKKSLNVSKDKVPSDTILSLEMSSLFTGRVLSEMKEQIVIFEPRLSGVLPDIGQISLFLSAVDQQRLLPVPAISFLLDVKNRDSVQSAVKEIIKSSLQENSMVPPGADWISEGDNVHTILTALGEEVSIISSETQLAISSSKDIAKTLMSDVVSSSASAVSVSGLYPATGEKGIDIGTLYINFLTLTQAMDKVFAMSGAFGAKPQMPAGEFNPELFVKALSSVGLAGSRVYLDASDVLVVKVRTKRP
jgi:hypothetical protein